MESSDLTACDEADRLCKVQEDPDFKPPNLGMNRRARDTAEAMIAGADALRVETLILRNGARVIDCGVNAPGGFAAGLQFARICLGGLGEVSLIEVSVGDLRLPGIQVSVDRPVYPCMASQYAGWMVKGEKFFAMGSGPARALARAEDLFQKIGYREDGGPAVLALEGRKIPGEAVVEYVASKCGVSPEDVWLVVAPTAGLVGSVQVSARVVETGLHKLLELGFDLHSIISGFGTCPLSPVAEDDLKAIGQTNDCVLYGGRVWYTVNTSDEAIEAVVERVPSSSSKDYGTSFYELYRRYGGFYEIDPMLFSPAEVAITNVRTGRTFRVGRVNPGVLERSLLRGVGA